MPDHELMLFVESLRARLMKGVVTYENKSFSKSPGVLLEELKQEALDLAGWGFILWCRLEKMRAAIEVTPPRGLV